jgi:hypothetical protein
MEVLLGWCHLMPTGCYIDVLQQVVGVLATAIHGRMGGTSSTSVLEALNQPCRGCSKSPYCEVIRSPQLGGGPRRRALAGKGLLSSWLWFLGGDAWRMPPMSGRDTGVLDCVDLISCRVFYVNCRPLSSNIRFLERVFARGLLKTVILPL